MVSILILSAILLGLTVFMMTMCSMISKKSVIDREKCSPFECGFDPKSSSRNPFSLRFFLIAIIFLVFDVEIALILPIVPIFHLSNIQSWSCTSLLFIVILLAGLYHEWNEGMLNWSK